MRTRWDRSVARQAARTPPQRLAIVTAPRRRFVKMFVEFVCTKCHEVFFVARDRAGDRQFGPCRSCGGVAQRKGRAPKPSAPTAV